MEACYNYAWPGNVRELINVVERAVLISDGEQVLLEDLPDGIRKTIGKAGGDSFLLENSVKVPESWLTRSLKDIKSEVVDHVETAYIIAQLTNIHGNIGKTAERAGLDPRSVYSKMKLFGLKKEDFKDK